jgi:hypothetical protein
VLAGASVVKGAFRKGFRNMDKHDAKEMARLKEIGRGNVERHADWAEDASADEIHDCVYTLAFDKIYDECGLTETARTIARELAMEFAAP